MREPSFFEYFALIAVCLILASIGLYLLANFSRLFRKSIRNELLRQNVAVWLIIFCLATAMAPIQGGFFYMIAKKGWIWATVGQIIGTTLLTVFVFNIARLVAQNRSLKRLSFVKHNLLIFATLITMTVLVNLPFYYVLYDYQTQFLRYTVISSVYLGSCKLWKQD